MILSGQLSDFSLPEIFQVVEEGKQTGILTVWMPNDTEHKIDRKYIYFAEGRVISASDNLSGFNLLNLIQKQNLIEQTAFLSAQKLIEEFKLKVPLGEYLQGQHELDLEQIKSVFEIQVIQKVCSFFEIEKAWFTFNASMCPTLGEVTGISANATELSLMALRLVKKWTNFTDKFPDITSGLLRAKNNKTFQALTPLEQRIVEFSGGDISLKQISQKTGISLGEVQKIAFCLISTGLAEELPIPETFSAAQLPEVSLGKVESRGKSLCVHQDFLTGLSDYLKVKASSEMDTNSYSKV